jgi:hypothetical protein
MRPFLKNNQGKSNVEVDGHVVDSIGTTRTLGPLYAQARAAVAKQLAYQPILGRRLGSSGLAGQGAMRPFLKNNQRKSNVEVDGHVVDPIGTTRTLGPLYAQARARETAGLSTDPWSAPRVERISWPGRDAPVFEKQSKKIKRSRLTVMWSTQSARPAH